MYLTDKEIHDGVAFQQEQWPVGDSTDNSTKAEPRVACDDSGAPDHQPSYAEGGYCR